MAQIRIDAVLQAVEKFLELTRAEREAALRIVHLKETGTDIKAQQDNPQSAPVGFLAISEARAQYPGLPAKSLRQSIYRWAKTGKVRTVKWNGATWFNRIDLNGAVNSYSKKATRK